MKKGRIAAYSALLLLLLITLGSDADMCKFHSTSFVGECFHNMNCLASCTTEGGTGGFCQGIMLPRVCMCTKEYGGGGGDNGGGRDHGGGGGGGGRDDGGPPAAEFTAKKAAWSSGGHV